MALKHCISVLPLFSSTKTVDKNTIQHKDSACYHPNKRMRCAMVAIIALATISPVGAQADNTVLEMHQQNNIPYVSGGIGDDEKAELEATQANYNFRVINADKAGHFFGNTRIVVSDMKGNVLLDTTSGPLFYANLPKGKYSVESYSNEQVKKKIVTIAEGKSAQIRFMWSEEMNDEATR